MEHIVLFHVGNVHHQEKNFKEAQRLYEEAIAIARAQQHRFVNDYENALNLTRVRKPLPMSKRNPSSAVEETQVDEFLADTSVREPRGKISCVFI